MEIQAPSEWFLPAYYYACGRNDANQTEYYPPMMFANSYVAHKDSNGGASMRTYFEANLPK